MSEQLAEQGTQCALVNWEGFSLKYMQLMAVGMGGRALADLIDVWVKHLETSGLPDLFMLRVKWQGATGPDYAMELVDGDMKCVDIAAWCAAGSDEAPMDAMLEQTVEAQFVEVKGPRDRLSDTQIVWLERLNAARIAAVVCYVQEPKKAPVAATSKKRTKKADAAVGKQSTTEKSNPPTKKSKRIPPPHVPIEIFDY
ncbi:hypothetical protein DYB32_000457 [Aphanomyces invadans]|uniref:Fanconi-associated nuclease n=1 Tax=Aphanomyces invadans TaxID=157072 RepID=A0A418BA29_9STRA|nr:hypothetical protein DYB32_000457 [Aphanomyces invadans]